MPNLPSSRRLPVVTDLIAVMAPQRRAVLGPPFPLQYRALPADTLDLPDFPRAASALRRWHGRQVVIQDDVNALAIGELAATGTFEPWLLPRGPGQRRQFEAALGNKHEKLDLEAALTLPDGRLVAFGSGSLTSRQHLVSARQDGSVRILDASELYETLRAEAAFAGSELNLEGALALSGWLILVQRGNGAAASALSAVNALGFLPLAGFTRWLDGDGPSPRLERIIRVALGSPHGVRVGFTDATLKADGTLAFLACAEDTPNAVDDGAVAGSYFGEIDLGAEHATLVEIVESDGRPCRLKLEGIEAHPRDPELFDVVADTDDPNVPALAAVLRVSANPESLA